MEDINNGKKPQKCKERRSIMFVRSGQQSFLKQKKKTVNDERWSGAWKIAGDLPGCEHFFPIPTRKKPDIVVWCEERKIVHLVELTVSHEDNIDAAQIRKDERYEQLLDDCEESGWSAKHFSVEVGCRGFIGKRLRCWLFAIGLRHRQVSSIMKRIQAIVEKASH